MARAQEQSLKVKLSDFEGIMVNINDIVGEGCEIVDEALRNGENQVVVDLQADN
ncbi:hypothetical protein CAEBREN_10801 [Caenorhabditis brenneri]|uniref:Uncharacterized protein n=1 Tax=Caenorhabditis brenneri TaxID=135651 RepID=G0PH67_CAEBE|nr:hypothetical protein CAEBREN_10801 [Caenorhabditis brenneri]